MSSPHFEARCRERGITKTCPAQLAKDITEAIRNGLDFVEHVFSTPAGASFYRFECADGIFYAICGTHSGKCITLYTQDMMKSARAARKQRKGGHIRHNAFNRGYKSYKKM
jgi:hypothetical protein